VLRLVQCPGPASAVPCVPPATVLQLWLRSATAPTPAIGPLVQHASTAGLPCASVLALPPTATKTKERGRNTQTRTHTQSKTKQKNKQPHDVGVSWRGRRVADKTQEGHHAPTNPNNVGKNSLDGVGLVHQPWRLLAGLAPAWLVWTTARETWLVGTPVQVERSSGQRQNTTNMSVGQSRRIDRQKQTNQAQHEWVVRRDRSGGVNLWPNTYFQSIGTM